MKQKLDPTVKDVLKLVNLYRKEMKLSRLRDLPKGYAQESHSCPIAKALGKDKSVCVTNGYIHFTEREQVMAAEKAWGVELKEQFTLSTPVEFQDFVLAFDRGQLPQYLLKQKD